MALKYSKRMEDYELLETVGIGAFGKVKKALYKPNNTLVAIKCIPSARVGRRASGDCHEIRCLRRLHHPNIIRLLEAIDLPEELHMVMEYVSGGDLLEYVGKHQLDESTARHYFRQIIFAIDYCHSRNVVHRDLKPENLLLDSDGRIRLSDFGLSAMLKDGHHLQSSCGSAHYAAPEVICGKPYAGPEIDVWSCGVILYSMLTGFLPFDDESAPKLYHTIQNGIYSIPAHVSDCARDLVRKMLHLDPLQRISVSEIKNHAWFVGDGGILDAISGVANMEGSSTAISMFQSVPATASHVCAALRLSCTSRPGGSISDKLKNLVSRGIAVYPPFSSGGRCSCQHPKLSERRLKEPTTNLIDCTQGEFGRPAKESYCDFSPVATSLLPRSWARPRSSGVRVISAAHRRWILGIRSTQPAIAVVRAIFRQLSLLGFKWKSLGNYRISCKNRTAVFQLQIYRVDRLNLAIDVQKCEGIETMSFMDLIIRLFAVQSIIGKK